MKNELIVYAIGIGVPIVAVAIIGLIALIVHRITHKTGSVT